MDTVKALRSLAVPTVLSGQLSVKSEASTRECYPASDRGVGPIRDFLTSRFTDLSKRSVDSAGSNAEFLEIILRGNGRRNPISSLGFTMRNLLGWLRQSENRNIVDKFELKGIDQETGLVDSVDLLEDKLIGKVSVRRDYENQRHVYSPDMYSRGFCISPEKAYFGG